MTLFDIDYDPILEAIDAELVAENRKELPRQYLGASSVGGNCERALFYNFRWAARGAGIEPYGLRAIADGHATEQVMIKRLRMVGDVELWVEEGGKQIGFVDIAGHFQGNIDGIIKHPSLGTAVWENKCCNVKKFEKLKKLKAEDAASALKKWDTTYYGQAQIYMHYMGLPRHYLTCLTPGGRDMASIVTEYSENDALALVDRARRTIFGDRPAPRISSDPSWYECKWCRHFDVCHSFALPDVNCRTCAHSSPNQEGGWRCEKFDCNLSFEAQLEGCVQHRFNPVLVNGQPIERDDEDRVTYKLSDGSTYIDGNK